MIRNGRPMTSVVYDNAQRHVIEYRFDGPPRWKRVDCTAQTGAPTTEPHMACAYQRSDGVTSFVYSSHPSPDHHIMEMGS
jgi:hypothetical protein